jgi:hypothetical protein
MLGDGKWNSGDQGSFFKYQYGVLKLLESINASIGALPGIDYETRTTTYVAIAPGAGYVIGDIIVRYDIIDVATSTLAATIWFNQTTQTTIAAPAPATITPYLPPGNVTVTNPFNLEATQLLVLAAFGPLAKTVDITALSLAITTALGPKATTADITALSLAITTALGPQATAALQTTLNGLVATAANQVTQTALLTTIDADTGSIDTKLTTTNALLTTIDADTGSIDSKLNTLGQKLMAGSVPVVLASDQTAIPTTLPTGAQAITSSIAAVAGTANLAATATSVGFTTDSTFTGTINLIARNSSTFYGFEATPGKTLSAIPYTVTAGNVIIDVIV